MSASDRVRSFDTLNGFRDRANFDLPPEVREHLIELQLAEPLQSFVDILVPLLTISQHHEALFAFRGFELLLKLAKMANSLLVVGFSGNQQSLLALKQCLNVLDHISFFLVQSLTHFLE